MLAVFAALTACGGGSGSPEVAPKNLFYAQPPASLVGDPIAVMQATVDGPVNSYTVAPALPQGLTLNPLTGSITGIPSESVTDGSYLVTATNKTGSTHFAVVFTISDKTQEEAVSAGSLALTSADPATLVNVASPLQFQVTGAQLPTTTAGMRVFNSGREIPPANISVQGNVITVSSALEDGRNDLVVLAADVKDGALGYQGTLWAGSSTLTVSVTNPDGTIPANATVVARLMDQGGLAIQKSTSSGQVTLQNVPNRTVLFSATAAGNLTANLTAVGVAGTVQLKLQGFTTASTIDNNDFTAGTAGWQPSSSNVISIVPHVEDITPVPQASVVKPSPLSAARQQERQQWAQQAMRMQAGGSKLGANPAPTAEPAPANPDLSLTTSGEGPASVSRTFTVPAGASQVKIRYRFITSEVPGGYFGSQYN
ncbi:MAG: putative Ig domain-containing protein, partial [Pseudomonadota bacterium]|nr:putative Ig domain-containing protein [Pseudomonadota bacterium]